MYVNVHLFYIILFEYMTIEIKDLYSEYTTIEMITISIYNYKFLIDR